MKQPLLEVHFPAGEADSPATTFADQNGFVTDIQALFTSRLHYCHVLLEGAALRDDLENSNGAECYRSDALRNI